MLLLTHAETQTGQCINKTKVQIQNSSMPSSVSMWPMRSRCPNEFPRVSDTLAEKAWEGAAQGIGKILVHVTFLKTKLIFASSVKRKEVRGDGVYGSLGTKELLSGASFSSTLHRFFFFI